jgi:hypothetical protein
MTKVDPANAIREIESPRLGRIFDDVKCEGPHVALDRFGRTSIMEVCHANIADADVLRGLCVAGVFCQSKWRVCDETRQPFK